MTRPRPPYSLLHKHYPDRISVPTEELYAWIGYPEYVGNASWQNTCAIRVSICLLGAGVMIRPGHMTVKAGKWEGRRIEQGQKRLADFLLAEWGEPEKFGGALARESIGMRRGVASFSQLWGPYDAQGHIDIVAPDQWNRLICEGSCYWDSVEVSFWPML